MSGINTGFTVNSADESRVFTITQQQRGEVGAVESDPLRRGHEMADAVVELGAAAPDHENDSFSHNRHQALSAYLGNADSSEKAAAAEGQDQTVSADLQPGAAPAAEEAEEDADEKYADNDTKQNGEKLTDDEQNEVDELKDRDEEVRTHEMAHMSAAGGLATGPYYEYQQGPDGKRYAVGGHVNIDTSEESTPSATAQKMRKVIASANAPAEPSSQDRAVAAEAQRKLAEAQQEMTKESRESNEDEETDGSGNSATDEADGSSGADEAQKTPQVTVDTNPGNNKAGDSAGGKLS